MFYLWRFKWNVMYAKPWFSKEPLPFLRILYSQTLYSVRASNVNQNQQTKNLVFNTSAVDKWSTCSYRAQPIFSNMALNENWCKKLLIDRLQDFKAEGLPNKYEINSSVIWSNAHATAYSITPISSCYLINIHKCWYELWVSQCVSFCFLLSDLTCCPFPTIF